MWLLLLVMINLQTGQETRYVLNYFPIERLCVVEGKRIATDMAAAYPGDKDYRIECSKRRLE
jgi:hypothetical protein